MDHSCYVRINRGSLADIRVTLAVPKSVIRDAVVVEVIDLSSRHVRTVAVGEDNPCFAAVTLSGE